MKHACIYDFSRLTRCVLFVRRDVERSAAAFLFHIWLHLHLLVLLRRSNGINKGIPNTARSFTSRSSLPVLEGKAMALALDDFHSSEALQLAPMRLASFG